MSFLIMGRGISPGLFAAPHMSPVGTSRHFAATRNFVRYRGIADSGKLTAQEIYGFTA